MALEKRQSPVDLSQQRNILGECPFLVGSNALALYNMYLSLMIFGLLPLLYEYRSPVTGFFHPR